MVALVLMLACGPPATTAPEPVPDAPVEPVVLVAPYRTSIPRQPKELCDGLDNDFDGRIDEDFDRDGDGFTRCEEQADCDDDNRLVHPGAVEYCDVLDHDCDGSTDESGAVDAHTWTRDGDQDGHGDDAQPLVSCRQPEGYAASAGDCDDTDPDIHPGAPEACDHVDWDCDGEVLDDHALDAGQWVSDADGDGYGTGSGIPSCEPIEGLVDQHGDCDDADPAVSPGAVEVWYDGVDQDCDGGSDDDADRDSFIPVAFGGTDCDDEAEQVSPAQAEQCNGVDDDCDGQVDEDATDAFTVYVDSDGDGFGGTEDGEVCQVEADQTTTPGDCDDSDSARHPGAAETWYDGVDQDCAGDDDDDADGDGHLPESLGGWDCDDEDPEARPDTHWYADADGDGFGEPGQAWTGCERPDGMVADETDCDDGDPSTYPAAPELCDGVDRDCDGAVDEAGAQGEQTQYWDADGDGYGTSDAATIVACPGKAGYAPSTGDCDDSDSRIWVGAAEVCGDWVDNDCDLSTPACGLGGDMLAEHGEGWILGSQAGEEAGSSLVAADLDGDGVTGLGIGAPAWDGGSGRLGWYTSAGSGDQVLDDAWLVVAGAQGDEGVGSATATVDADGDGLLDLIVGAPGADSGWGEVWLLLAPSGGTLGAGDADGVWAGVDGSAATGAAVVSLGGDADGDGLEDWVVGSPGASGGAGLVTGYSGSGESGGSMAGSDVTDALGTAVASAGDVDGDGLPDVVIGAPGAAFLGTDGGAVALVLGPLPTGAVILDGDAVLFGSYAGDALGTSVAGAGDVDGDGLDDLWLGQPGADSNGTDAGSAWFVSGTVRGVQLAGDVGAMVLGESAHDGAGGQVSAAGDLDGDGHGDLALGIPARYYGASETGAVAVLLGPLTGTHDLATDSDLRVLGQGAYDHLGAAFVVGQDFTGDGTLDLWAGVPGLDEGGSAAGGAVLFTGDAEE